MECYAFKIKDRKGIFMYVCMYIYNTESNLDNMSNAHKIILKAQKVTYTQKQHSKKSSTPLL